MQLRKAFGWSFFNTFILILFLFSQGAFIQKNALAAPRTSSNRDLAAKKVGDKLQQFAQDQLKKQNPVPAQVLFLSEIVTDRIIDKMAANQWQNALFREEEVSSIMDILTRDESRYPMITGEVGVGKSTVIDEFAYNIVTENLPEGAHTRELKNAVVFRISARAITAGGMDFSLYLSTLKFMASHLKQKIILCVTETHMLKNDRMVNAGEYVLTILHEEAKKADHIPIIFEVHNKDMSGALGSLPSLDGLIAPITISALKPEQIKDAVKAVLKTKLEEKMRAPLADELINTAIDIAPDYNHSIGEPRRTFILLEDFAIQFARKNQGNSTPPTKSDLYKFIAQKTGVPVVPQDEEKFSAFMSQLKNDLKKEIVNQDNIIDGLVDQFRTALMSRTRQHSVALLVGPTGVGKTYVAERLAERFYGSKERVLDLDMTQFTDDSTLSVLFGASNGILSSNTDKGRICEFLDGRGRGGNVIILNEIEKAHSSVITRFMELFDKGEILCGDGKIRYLGRSLIVMTSNKNTERLMSYEAIRGMSEDELKERLDKITENDISRAFTKKSTYTEDSKNVVSTPVIQRADRFYFASPLLSSHAIKVASLEVRKYENNFKKQYDRTIHVDPSFSTTISTAFYNEENGARQLRKAIPLNLDSAIDAYKKKFGFDKHDLIISASLHITKKTESYITVSSADGRNELTVPGPRLPVDNKLLDEEFRNKLQTLEANLNSEIFGQSEAIKKIVASVLARFLKVGKQKPASGFFMGTTGTGKSKLAKLLNKYLFGREDGYGLFEMGRVKDKHDIADIFSPPKGVIGSDSPGQLEQYLIDHPNGGVLIFDEISNAGGNDIALKNSIFKQFYQMVDEGIHTTPSGKYDLSNYILIFTGNDGEKVFKGAGSDAMIDLIYKDFSKHPEKAKDILREAGVSDAFLGRLDFVAMMRPAMGDLKRMIAEKMLNEWRREVMKSQPVEIHFSENFVSEIADLIFSIKAGARSIEQFITGVLGQAVTTEIVRMEKSKWDELIETGAKAKIQLSMQVTKPTQPFYASEKPDPKSAVLIVELAHSNGQVLSSSETNFTDMANFMSQLHIESATFTAYHEMGHAVVSFTDYTGKKVERISIVPQSFSGGMAAGITMYDRVPTRHDQSWEVLIRHLAGVLAGSEAELLANGHRNTGRSNDVEQAGNIARKIILEGHLVPELDGAQAFVAADGSILPNMPPKMKVMFAKSVDKALAEARALSIEYMRENWHVMEAGKKLLLQHHELTGEDFERLVKRGEEAKANASSAKRDDVARGIINAAEAYPMSLDGIVIKPEAQKDAPKKTSAPSVKQSSGEKCVEALS